MMGSLIWPIYYNVDDSVVNVLHITILQIATSSNNLQLSLT